LYKEHIKDKNCQNLLRKINAQDTENRKQPFGTLGPFVSVVNFWSEQNINFVDPIYINYQA
jgi:hypothetical protein